MLERMMLSQVKDEFYDQLQAVIERTPSHDMLVMMGD